MNRSRLDRLADAAARHWVECLSVLWVLFILANTLVPLDFGEPMPDPAARRLLRVTFSRIAWTDLAANTALYVPFGLLAAWTARRRGVHATTAAVRILALSAALSLATETAQALSPSRVSSIVDVGTNLIGAGLGIVLFGLASTSASGLQRDVWSGWRAAPWETRAKAYVGLLFLLGLMPYSMSLDMSRLKTAWKQATWVPFVEYFREAPAGGTAGPSDLMTGHVMRQRTLYETALGDVAEMASFMLLVWLVLPALRREYGFRRVPAVMLTSWLALFLAGSLGALQFVVIGRGFHATDVLARLIGAFCGLLLAPLVRSFAPADHRQVVQPCARRTAAFLACLVIAYILASGTIPFIGCTDDDRLAEAARSEAFLPFFAYFRGRFDVAMRDLMSKAASYFLLGAALSATLNRSTGVSRPVGAAILAAALLSAVIEAAQVFILSRVPSLTDVLIATVAAPCGALAIFQFGRLTQRTAESAAAASNAPVRRPGELSLTDRLVAQLIDPPARMPGQAPAHGSPPDR